jgi:hypothetical protein
MESVEVNSNFRSSCFRMTTAIFVDDLEDKKKEDCQMIDFPYRRRRGADATCLICWMMIIMMMGTFCC